MENYVARGELKFRKVRDPMPTRVVNLVYPDTHLDNLATTAVASCIRDAIMSLHKNHKWIGELLVNVDKSIA
jgi:hypothetical protein